MDPVVLIFAALALFVIFKLISVLGTRTGHEQRHDIEGLQRAARAAEAAHNGEDGTEKTDQFDTEDDEPIAPKPAVSAEAKLLQEADPSFDEKSFLEGAKSAYELIVEAFAEGDVGSIRQYLETSVYDAFKQAASTREAAGQTFDLKFVGIETARLESASVEKALLQATVDFVSNQVRTTYDSDGNVVDGDPNRIDLVKDRWTFSRKLNASDPNWTLVATGAA